MAENIAGIVGIVLLLGLAALAARAIDRLIARRKGRDVGQVAPTEISRQRIRTAQRVLKGLTVAVLIILAIGIGLETFDAGAGLILAVALFSAVLAAFSGAAWGSDIVAGVGIVLEGQYFEGDWVEVRQHKITGKVESLSLRATTLRSIDGTRWVVPNGEMRISGNKTYEFSRYIFILRISYEDDVETAMSTIETSYADLKIDPTLGPSIKRLRILGVDDYGASGIDIKLFLETDPGAHWRVGREFRRRLKPALDRAGVHVPYEHREVILRTGEAGAGDGNAQVASRPD